MRFLLRWVSPVAVIGTLVALSGQLRAQQDGYPSTPLANFGRQLVAALNGDSPERVETVLRAFASQEALRGVPLAEQLSFWETVRAQSGGLSFVAADTVPGVLEIRVRTVRADHYEKIYMFNDKRESGKFSEVGIIPILDPAFERKLAFPETKMSADSVVAEISRRVDLAAANDLLSGVVLVADDRRILYEKAVGLAEQSFNVPNNLETKFHLGSMNKMFTSIAIAQLVEAGKLRFTDTLARILPEYPNREAAEKITIHHLLTHTAGLRTLFDNPAYDRRKKYWTHLELVDVFARQPLLFEPGSRSSYSNEGFVVLGAVIEKLTGQRYGDYVREHICRPAGMENTDLYRVDEATPNLAIGYGRFEDDPLGIAPRRPNWMFLGWRGNACGGGYSTAPDLLKFSRALRGNVLLSREMTELITTPKFKKWYGYGFSTRTASGKSIRGHGGGGPNSGVDSEMDIIWDSGTTVIVLGNYDATFASDFCAKITDFLAAQE